MTKPLEYATTDQEIIETVAENGPNLRASGYINITKVLVAFARTLLNLQQVNKPRSVPISERAMEARHWDSISELNDRDFLVCMALKGERGVYYDPQVFLRKFVPIVARSLLTNQIEAQPYKDSFNGCCKCGRQCFHDTRDCQVTDKMEW